MNLSVKRLFDMIIVWKNWKPGKLNGKDTGSDLDCSTAPWRSKLYIACSAFFQKSERAHAAAPPFQIATAYAGFRFVFLHG